MSEATPSLTDKSYPTGSQISNIIIIVITIKDFSVHINPDAMLTIKIEKLQLDFTNLEYINIEIKN